MTTVPTPPTTLLAKVSRRLFIALLVLVTVALVLMIMASSTDANPYVALPVIMGVGMIGGFVGLQRRLKNLTIGDLELIAESWVYTCLSPLVGGVLAILLYVLFLSTLVASPLFPTFVPDNSGTHSGFGTIFDQKAAGYADYAKLLFWCFIAGFSERFVTDVIGRFEGTAVKDLGA